MCGRYRLSRVDKLAERFDIEPDDDWAPRYNIASAQNIPVIRQHPEEPKRYLFSALMPAQERYLRICGDWLVWPHGVA
jgi:putative SOS response-associated peptidase YedK